MSFNYGLDGEPVSCAIPLSVAQCPCCGSALDASFEEWDAEEPFEPEWDMATIDCSRPECYDEYKDSEYWRMPYVYWLPVEVTCKKWMQRQWNAK